MDKVILYLRYIIILVPVMCFTQVNNTYAHNVALNSAQIKDNSTFYNEALKHYNLKEYKKADSLFTISLMKYPHKDTYVNRAVCRKKLLNIEGYCYDLSMALMLGDEESKKVFLTECGTIDTTYFDKQGSPGSKDKFECMEVKINSGFKDIEITYVYNSKGALYTKYKTIDSIGKIYLTVDVGPQHEGTEGDFFFYIKKNLRYPPDIKKIGKSVFVRARFIVNEKGKIVKIIQIGASEKCDACISEAERFILGISKWKPAKINNIPVQSIDFITLKFDIDKAYK